MDWYSDFNSEARKGMELDTDLTFINNAAISLKPQRSLRAITTQLERITKNGLAGIDFQANTENLKRISHLAASLINSDASKIALVHSTSEGLLVLASGLNYDTFRKKNIILPEKEFIANSIVWQILAKKLKSEIITIPLRSGRYEISDFESAINENVGLVCISSVQFRNGFNIELRPIADLIHDVGGLIVVDGIQQIGAKMLDVKKTDIDFLAVGGYKWLVSPLDTGFIYVKPSLQNELVPLTYNWSGSKDLVNFIHHAFVPRDDASRYQTIASGNPYLFGLRESLEFINELSLSNIERYIEHITSYFIKRIQDEFPAITIASPVETSSERSAIVSLETPNSDDMWTFLKRTNIVVGVTDGNIRVAPHFFTSFGEIDQLLEQMHAWLKSTE